MRVLVVPTWYPSGEDKLMGNYHKEFTYALNKNGIKADMLFIDRQRSSKPIKYLFMKKKAIDKEENYNVYKYRMLNYSFVNFDFALKKYVEKFEKSLNDYINKNGKPGLLHAQVTIPAGYACAVVGKKLGIPVVVTEHCSSFKTFFKGKLEKYGKFVLENTCFSVVSNYMKEEILKFKNECFVIPNIVDIDLFKCNKKRKIDKCLKLISVCALRQGKKIDVVFKAMRKLIDEGYNIQYMVVGDGFEENYYKSKCIELELENNVTFAGRRTKKQISDLLSDMHALVISSDVETFAIPGIEALASGIPVISTKCLGPEEYINEDNGLLCEIDDADSLALAIKKLYSDYEKYEPKILRESIMKFSSKNVALVAKKIYEGVIK